MSDFFGSNPLPFIAIVLGCYLIGNISPAILIGRMAGIDIKKEGSGNAGTTNVLRVLGKKAAAATLAIDILKGVLAVLIGRYFGSAELEMVCAFAVLCGHIWPVAFKFKGGKGVATAFGTIITIDPLIGGVLIAIALLIMASTKRVSAGAIIAAIIFPFLVYFLNPEYLLWAICAAVIILAKHHSNIGRLLKGQEPKLNFKK